MMNQVGNTETLAPADPSLLENQFVSGTSQVQTSLYHPTTTGSEGVAWAAPRVDGGSSENGFLPNSSYHYNQHTHAPARNAQDGLSATSVATSSSSFVAANGPQVQPQDYSYASYPNSTSTYGYGSTGYEGYYNTYQQQSNHPYTQPVSYQNTGAPYQPNSSFQNTGFYPGSSSYSTTYYTTGDYQTAGGYPSSSYPSGCYSNQATSGTYANYAPHQYANYSADSTGAYSSGSATATSQHYQQQYQQWADYYSQTEVSCAPGTEKLSVASTSNLVGPTSGLAGGYSAPSSQPTASYLPSWRPESSSSGLTPVQLGVVTSGSTDDAFWKPGAPNSQVNHTNITQPNFQKPLDLKNSYDSFQDHQKNLYAGGSNSQNLIAHQGPQSYQSLSETDSSLDTRRVSKVQIPTNPRIAPNLTFGVPKSSVDSSTTNAAAKPAYISVSMPKSIDKVSSKDTTESMWKPAMFPKSLRGYVERALARCKDETQMASCQSILKEMITNATGDGTLYTRNWDIEPMFQLPNADIADKNNSEIASPVSALPKYKRSPTRKFKSRWEPLPEVKAGDEHAPVNVSADNFKDGDWANINERDKKTLGRNSESKSVSNSRFPSWDQKTDNKIIRRKFKKQRLMDGSNATDICGASSDSDKEQNLTGYFTGVVALADSPEERMRRENRSKRFEKGRGLQVENSSSKHKNAGNSNTRRASALILSKNLDDSGSRAVEDIDWDSLTVKGTCQEIEKRYLRLTSAPDPACVRPEEVLDRALHMVQNSEKNYLYKCDQLKSIRQDLTVQRIRNQLTVKVYETHARLALEFGDLPEYNQCQSQLKILYAEGIQGCHMEFAAYNLLCVILHSNNNRDLLSQMSRLSDEAKVNEMVKHALAVRAAVTSGNYVTFFRLYKDASNISTCLMDLYVEKMRYKAINCITRSYRPTAPVSYVAQVLGFTNVMPVAEGTDKDDSDGLEECVEWLKAHGAHLVTDNNGEMQLDAKASSSSLHMPEPEDAVPHGDSNLAVNDFLTRTTHS